MRRKKLQKLFWLIFFPVRFAIMKNFNKKNFWGTLRADHKIRNTLKGKGVKKILQFLIRKLDIFCYEGVEGVIFVFFILRMSPNATKNKKNCQTDLQTRKGGGFLWIKLIKVNKTQFHLKMKAVWNYYCFPFLFEMKPLKRRRWAAEERKKRKKDLNFQSAVLFHRLFFFLSLSRTC